VCAVTFAVALLAEFNVSYSQFRSLSVWLAFQHCCAVCSAAGGLGCGTVWQVPPRSWTSK